MVEYESYQKSPVRWCKKFPSKWKFERAKNLYRKENRSVRDIDKVVTCFRDGQVTLRENRRTTGFTESIKEIGYQGIRKGDLVIHVMDAFAGAIGVSDSDGKGSPIYSVCTAKADVNNYYYAYLLRETARNGYIKSLYRGIRERSSDFRFDVFANELYPVPPRAEQDQIVRFLDWKVSEINKLIGIRKKEISLLKERYEVQAKELVKNGVRNDKTKDSGIDYIGRVPSHWTVLLNSRVFKEKIRSFEGNPLVLSLSQKDGLLPYKDMTERSLHTASYDNWKLVFPNDLVLNRFKAHLGVFFSSKYEGIVTFHYGVFEPRMKVNSKYYEILYHTPEYKAVYAGQSNGMTVGLQNLSNQHFYSVYTIYPPYEEQCEIVDEISRKEQETKDEISTLQKNIETLQELKSVIISDVVTGKIDVRNITVPEYEHVDGIADDDAEDSDEDTEETEEV